MLYPSVNVDALEYKLKILNIFFSEISGCDDSFYKDMSSNGAKMLRP